MLGAEISRHMSAGTAAAAPNGAVITVDPAPEPDSWQPIDLGPYLRGEITPPEPTCGMYRTDRLQLLYPGREHAAVGEMESGKSWLALGCAMAEIIAGRHVLYAHFEESDPSSTIERLQLLDVPDQDIIERFHFIGPERPVTHDALDALLPLKPSLVVLDGVNEAMSLHKTAIRDEDGAAEFRRRLIKPFTRAGAAVLSLDHVVKDPEKRSRVGIGSVHKGNALSGALIQLDNTEPFGRNQRGRSRLYVTKDRPGYLRQHGKPDRKRGPGWVYMGEFVIDATTDAVDMTLYAPKPDTAEAPEPRSEEEDNEIKVLHAIAALIVEDQPTNIRRIRAKAGMQGTAADDAIDRLLVSGQLTEKKGARNARLFKPTTVSETVSQDQKP